MTSFWKIYNAKIRHESIMIRHTLIEIEMSLVSELCIFIPQVQSKNNLNRFSFWNREFKKKMIVIIITKKYF